MLNTCKKKWGETRTSMRAQDDCSQLITFTTTRDKSAIAQKQQRERMKVVSRLLCSYCVTKPTVSSQAIAAFLLILTVGNSVALSNHAIVKGSGKAVESKPGLDLCPTCIGFANDFINDLLNIILSTSPFVLLNK